MKNTLLISLLSLSMISNAGAVIGHKTKLKSVTVDTNNGVLVQTIRDHVNPDDCHSSENYQVDPNSPYYSTISNALFYAKANDLEIIVTVQGCYKDLPAIKHVTYK